MEDFNGYCEGCGKPFTRVPAIGWECLTTGCDYRSEESKQAVLSAIKNSRKQTIAYKEGFEAGRKEQLKKTERLEKGLNDIKKHLELKQKKEGKTRIEKCTSCNGIDNNCLLCQGKGSYEITVLTDKDEADFLREDNKKLQQQLKDAKEVIELISPHIPYVDYGNGAQWPKKIKNALIKHRGKE